MKFYATKSRFHKYNIGVFASQRELLRTDENSRAPEICPVVPSRCVIFRNIFRMHQRRKYVSNISASDIALCRGIPNSHESPTSKYIFYARVFASLRLFKCACVLTLCEYTWSCERDRVLLVYKIPRYFYLYHRRAACTSAVNAPIWKSETNARWKI